MINKQVQNTGSAGGHGMTKIEVRAEIAKEDAKLLREHSGHTVGCGGSCGNTFHLNAAAFSLEDCKILMKFLAAGGCPYCGGGGAVWGIPGSGILVTEKDGSIWEKDRKFSPKPEHNYGHDTIEPHTVFAEGKEFNFVRKPDSWKPARKVRTLAQIAGTVRRQTKNWIK